jgi:hypothetical protein
MPQPRHVNDSFGYFLQAMRDADKNVKPDIGHIKKAFNLMSSKEKVDAIVELHELTRSLRDQLFSEIDAEVAATQKLRKPQPPKAS